MGYGCRVSKVIVILGTLDISNKKSKIMDTADLIESIKNIIQGLAVITGGGWVLYRFGLFRERFPSMEIENGVSFIGENSSEYLLELYCIVENKGKVRKWLTPFQFDLLELENGSPFEQDSKLNNEIKFSKRLKKTYWVLPTWHIPFVDGLSKKRFHYLVAIPKTVQFISLYTKFIDFKNKKKAVKYILSDVKIKIDESSWAEKSWNEKVTFLSSQKTDFYYTQMTTSIEAIKPKTAI